jgi:exodeoxyribonuclease-5
MKDLFGNESIELSDEQSKALDAILDFLKHPTKQKMVLAGYAGCGKTTLMRFLVKKLDSKVGRRRFKYTCTAPTNEAVRVLSKAVGEDFDKTIFSLRGLVLQQDDDKDPYIEQKGRPHLHEFDLVVVDECSMIDRVVSEAIDKELKHSSRTKVLFVGDSAQLPPILDSGKGFTESIVFSIPDKVTLTTPMRTGKDNPIIDVVTPIRNNLLLDEDSFPRDTIISGENGVKFYRSQKPFYEDMLAEFKTDAYKDNVDHVRAIAYTNDTVDSLNKMIRQTIFDKDVLPEYLPNELMRVGQPVMKRISSSLSLPIYTVGDRIRVEEAEVVPANTPLTEGCFPFNCWKLKVKSIDERNAEQRTLLVPSFEHRSMFWLEMKRLAGYAKKLVQEMGKTVSKEAWEPYFEFKSKFATLKYAYAMTTHCSQGSTVQNVFVLENDMNKLRWKTEERNKLKYVAFTRAAKRLNVLE